MPMVSIISMIYKNFRKVCMLKNNYFNLVKKQIEKTWVDKLFFYSFSVVTIIIATDLINKI